MAYVYSPQTQRTRLATIARPNLPVRVVQSRSVAVRPAPSRARVMRVRFGGNGTDALGVVPAIAAAALPSVKDLLSKALNSIIGIVDPGAKRDANRKARADLWCSLANRGSITAARRVLGGSKVQYTAKERQYYIDCWTAFQKSKPMLAQQAITLGQLGIPEPGSDVTPPSIPTEDQTALQREIDAYDAATAAGATQLPAPISSAVASVTSGGVNPLLLLGAGILAKKLL